MRLELSDDHHEYAQVLDEALSRAGGVAAARQLANGIDGPSAVESVFQAVVTTGVVGLTVPEHLGGSGLTSTDCVLVFERLGQHLVDDTVALGVGVFCPVVRRHADGADGADLLQRAAAGELRISVQDGWSGWAPGVSNADVVMVVDDHEVVLVDAQGDGVESTPGTDGTRHLGRVTPTAPVRMRLNGAVAAREARLRSSVVTAGVLLGVGRRMVDLACDYARTRQQFGRPIGSFQAVKHQLADAYVSLESSRRTVWWASLCLDTEDSESDVAASTAKALAGEASRQASYAALQVHGGIGYTWECDLHLWMKRSQALEGAWGNADRHWRHLTTGGPASDEERRG